MANALSPAINLPILSEAVNIDISPTSQFGKAYDTARITTIIRLASPLQSPQRFLLPNVGAFDNPQITLEDGKKLSFAVDAIDAGALDKIKQQLLQEIQNFTQNVTVDTAKIAQDRIQSILSMQLVTTTEEIPENTQLIKFSYTKPIYRDASNIYKLESLVPMASFTLQNGGKIHMIIAMPFDPFVPPEKVDGFWVNPAQQQQALTEANITNRTILYAFWQQDPLLTITYQY